ncbi:MAG TPA: hypothetical protein VK024_01140 [Actinomycetaceae bacterium]|nr:hypothetical protein [Actinomycetaceae bacterium]
MIATSRGGLGLIDATVAAASVLELVQGELRGAFPRQWRSRAADAYAARLLDALVEAGRTSDLLEEAQRHVVACVAAAASARAADS